MGINLKQITQCTERCDSCMNMGNLVLKDNKKTDLNINIKRERLKKNSIQSRDSFIANKFCTNQITDYITDNKNESKNDNNIINPNNLLYTFRRSSKLISNITINNINENNKNEINNDKNNNENSNNINIAETVEKKEKEEIEKFFEKGLCQYSKIEDKNDKSLELNKEEEQSKMLLDNTNEIESKKIESNETMIDLNGDKFIFKGELDDKKNICGKGEIHYHDGRIYEGVFENGKLNGEGKYISSNGDIYEGIFSNGNLAGKGTIIKNIEINFNKSINSSEIHNEKNDCKKKYIYKGDIKDFKKEGKGIEECDEYKYEGNYCDDMKNGEGLLIYIKSGDKYQGEFKDDKITGKGNYTWSNGNSYKGDFIDGKMHGKGIYKWSDGTEYIGDYKDDIREGKGIFKWKNGVMFEGNFLKGKPEGKGEMKYKNNKIEVEYQNGNILGKFKDVIKKLQKI